ncbi:hypothetical protein H2204_014077 [Knufia peltigerae]|uniref:Uncharacterized protein n=1 Tax=Knufia peltigerae TaxID=1002370 RepID=A0AA39CQD9_9EURO|nr:hypothetical protein H2204_014077 [Knufia peltigerae]
MDEDDSQELLNTVLGVLAPRRPEKSAQPSPLSARKLAAWLRTEAYLQRETDDFGEIEPEYRARTLRALEYYVQFDSNQEPDLLELGIVLRNLEQSALEEDVMSDARDGFSDLPPELRQRAELPSSSVDEDMAGG